MIDVLFVGNTSINSDYDASCMTTKFQFKNSKLTLKVSKEDNMGITRKNDENSKKYKLTMKVSKNCKYRWEEFYRMTRESDSGKSNYRDVKKSIMGDRDFYKETGAGLTA